MKWPPASRRRTVAAVTVVTDIGLEKRTFTVWIVSTCDEFVGGTKLTMVGGIVSLTSATTSVLERPTLPPVSVARTWMVTGLEPTWAIEGIIIERSNGK